MLPAGKLRHRVVIEYPLEYQDTTGEVTAIWMPLAEVWAAIEPLSAREFTAAQAEQSKVVARVTVRYRSDITAKMRVWHEYKDLVYNIEGVLSDKDSGLDYLTLAVSEGVRYT